MNEVRSRAIRDRRERIGISARDLADRAGVSRGAVARALAGEMVRPVTYAALERTLDDIEEATSLDVPDEAVISTLELPGGITVTFQGSSEGVADAVAKFLSEHRTGVAASI